MKQERLKRLAVFAVLSIFWMTSSIAAALAGTAPTMGETYPEFSGGILLSAKLEKMDGGLLFKTDGFEIRDSFFEEEYGKVDSKIQKLLEKSMLFLLDQEVMERIIQEDARSMGIVSESPDEQTLKAYFDRVTKDVEVSEKDAKSFYDTNQEMVGGMPFDQVKESIQGFLLGKKKKEALMAHVEGLGRKANMRINKDWVKKQVAIAGDNPLDRARLSGKPTMIQFSSAGCPPCEMMKPILKKLKKKYDDSINFVSIPVDENQLLASRYNVQAVPVQVFFDKKGKRVHTHMGFMAEADIVKQLKEMGVI